MLGLNKILSASSKYRHRAQGVNAGVMATFNLGGINQFGEPFGLHLMDPLAGGSAAFASKDGVNAGGPITSPMSGIADVERNEQVVPLFYLHRRLSRDTGGAGKYRGGLGGEVALTLGGIESAQALIMTHGVEVPNSHGLGGGWPGATVTQRFGRDAIENGLPKDGVWETFGPKPGLMPMTNKDVFDVTWHGGGGWGDPLERDIAAVERDVADQLVSVEAALSVYGVVIEHGRADLATSRQWRMQTRKARVGSFETDPAKFCKNKPHAAISEALLIARDERGVHVVSSAGYILATGSTRWRQGAKAVTSDQPPAGHKILLHEQLAVTQYFCPASGTLLAVDFHERGGRPVDDVLTDPGTLASDPETSSRQSEAAY
jgi:N-methylhydantoinase B